MLEVCVDSLDSAQTYVCLLSPSSRPLLETDLADPDAPERALANGADRLEVCGALGVGGGLSPSVALLQLIRRALPTVPLMVRPLLPSTTIFGRLHSTAR